MSHTLYVIAGCNGAGKTTAFKYQLSRNANIADFINPDEAAREICPQDVNSAQYQAGRACIERFPRMLATGEDFCLETTLATRSLQSKIREAHEVGYKVHLYFYYLSTPEHAIKRVEQRVAAGGHNIESDVLLRRYTRGISYLLNIYKDMVDYWRITDNSEILPRVIANSKQGIIDHTAYNKLVRLSINEPSLRDLNRRPYLNIDDLYMISSSNELYNYDTYEHTLNYIRELIEDKASNNEEVAYSIDNELVVLSAKDVKWLFNKLFNGIEEWEYELLTAVSREGKNMKYMLDGCDISIPAHLVLNVIHLLQNQRNKADHIYKKFD